MPNIIIKSEEREHATNRTLSEYGIRREDATKEQIEMAEQFNSDYLPFEEEFRRMEGMR